MIEERALTFACDGAQLVGILSVPKEPCTRGVLIVVGGRQYRAGAHRQFALLARSLAADGIAALRFDYRGMGDSQGEERAFDNVEADLRAAIDRFLAELPQLREVVIWGLCDGASSAMLYAHRDARVRGLVLLNPWARTEDGHAKATLKHYYGARLFDPGFWRKLASGRFSMRQSLGSLLGVARRAAAATVATADAALPERLLDGLRRFDGEVLLILSGADLTAREFADVATAPAWHRQLDSARVTRRELPGADHTCSSHAWRDQVNRWTSDWVAQLPARRR